MERLTCNPRDLAPHARRIEKPWGWELLWAETESYCGKLLYIRAGHRISLQYHDEKLETQCLLTGRALLVIEDAAGVLREIEMERDVGYTIHPFQRHRLIALDDIEVVEVSTCETGTTYRLDDDYGRPDETEELRARR